MYFCTLSIYIEMRQMMAESKPMARKMLAWTCVCVAMFFLAVSCQRGTNKPLNDAEKEAQGLADTLRSTEELARWLHSYERQGEKRAALIVRQAYGRKLRDASNYEEAIAQHDTCLSIAKKLKDTTQIIIALNNQGTNMRRMGDAQSAAELHYAALELCDEFSDKTSDISQKNHVRSLNGLGNVLQSIGNLEAAEEYLKAALQGEIALNSATGQAMNLGNLGTIKKKQKDLDSARIYYTQSMDINRSTKNIIGISVCYHYLGEVDIEEGNTEGAISNFRQSYDTVLPTGDMWHWLESCTALANAYVVAEQTDSALKYAREALEVARKINSKENLALVYDIIAKCEYLRGQDKAAIHDLYTSLCYQDSVESKKDADQLHNLRVNYESKRRIREVNEAETRAESERTTRRIITWSSVAILLVLLGTFLVQLRANRIRKHAAKTLEHANAKLLRATMERQQFYRNITHQLRTPLTVVIGMVKQLEDHIAPDDEQGRVELDATQRQSRELLELVNRLVKASKQGVELPLNEMDDIIKEGTSVQKDEDTTSQPSDKTLKDIDNKSDKMSHAASVLIAEDNPDVAMLIQNIFQKNGYTTCLAKDGQEALDILLADELPDLIITDIAMPRMDGLELIRHIREDETMNHLPIIVVSARVEDSERLEGLYAGAEVYLAKPFIVEELLLRAHKLLEQRAILQRKFSNQEESEAFIHNLESEEQNFIALLNETIDISISEASLTSSTLAEKLCLSRSQLNRRVKNLTGDDTSHYIRNRRMLLASKLLTTTSLSIGEIETRCGFDTVGYFSRTFRSTYNMSPTEYRKSMLAEKDK